MINYFNVKKYLIKKCLHFYNETWLSSFDQENRDIVSFSFQIENVPLIKATEAINSNWAFYFKNKSETKQFLAINSILKVSTERLSNFTEKNPETEAFGGTQFSRESSWSELPQELIFVPRILLYTENGKTYLKCNILKEELKSNNKKANILFELEEIFSLKDLNRSLLIKETEKLIPEQDQWNKMINDATTLIKEDKINKIVLSRKKQIVLKTSLEAESLLEDIRPNPNSHFIYFKYDKNSCFISLSPETLFKIENNKLEIDIIAGTRPRNENIEEDKYLEKELMSCPKENDEHFQVFNDVEEKIKFITDKYSVTSLKEILKLHHVQHLFSKIEGKLNYTHNNISKLIDLFHPTPAIGGRPKKDALEYINKIETIKRGLFSAPLGIISKKYTELVVCIRSVKLNDNKIEIYAGAGIMKESIAKNEWDETSDKMKNFEIL